MRSWLICLFMSMACASEVTVLRLPAGGLQPQVVCDAQGGLHAVYLRGDAAAADVFYVKRAAGAAAWSEPLRVNSQPGAAVAMGTVRGAHLALGRQGRVQVAWLGSNSAQPRAPGNSTPWLYARLDPAAAAFTAQRNLVTTAVGLDGGGSIAADATGAVSVLWHAMAGANDEAGRRVFIATSTDDGETFSAERPAMDQATGVCSCCSLAAAAAGGRVAVLYRAAIAGTQRDVILLTSGPGQAWTGVDLQPWTLNQCPMSTAALLAVEEGGWLAAWQTGDQVWWKAVGVGSKRPGAMIPAPGAAKGRKHPALARQRDGRVLFAWSEGTGWNRGGSIHWQLFDAAAGPQGAPGQADGLPPWSLPAVATWGDGFAVIF